MIDFVFTFSNLIFAFSIGASLFLRLKYRRFGQIPKWWEKLGWLLMTAVVCLVLGDVAKSYLNMIDVQGFKITRVVIAAYFGWYAITMWVVTHKKKPLKTIRRSKRTKLNSAETVK